MRFVEWLAVIGGILFNRLYEAIGLVILYLLISWITGC